MRTAGVDAAPPRRVTGFVGLNPLAYREAAALGETIAAERLLISLNDPGAEKVLRDDPAVFDFVVDELGIDIVDFDRWDKATDILLNADAHLREQLADLMRWFNLAEQGEIVLERLVLSGHSNGVELWGEHEEGAESRPGTMVIERDLGTLASVFPRAAGQVEDVMFSACFSINAAEMVRNLFPTLRTAWSYGGFSPTVATGSIDDILAWSTATEGGGTPDEGLGRGSNALWTKEDGYVIGDPAAAAAGPLFSETVRGWRETAGPMYAGTKELSQPALDSYYVVAQQLIAHPAAGDDLKRGARLALQVVLRLRFWAHVAKRFGAECGARLQPAYDALGLAAPAWASLTRIELRAHMAAIDRALEDDADAGGHRGAIEGVLRSGLWRLEPDVIRSDWI